MKKLSTFADVRQRISCAYCGKKPESRDHVPSRVLLDEPYPNDLPVVGACLKCNQGFSADEEYFACLIDLIINGIYSPTEALRKKVLREKVHKILSSKPDLIERLTASRQVIDGSISFIIEQARVRNILLKLAQGHALYELNEPQLMIPSNIAFVPLFNMETDSRVRFERLPDVELLPELGSRAMQRILMSTNRQQEWIVVQPGQYRYATFANDKVTVRMVVSEYLACEVIWEDL